MKILLADDSKTTLALTASALQGLGHEVIGVGSGQEAIIAFSKSRPDLIILDVVMKGMDGFECAKQIRTISPDDWIPIIFLSSSVDDESIVKGINSGGDDYLAKPFSAVTLEAKIKAMQRIAEMRSKLTETTKELYILSSTDSLTGVYNRHMFEKTLREKLSASDRHHIHQALLYIDLDNFKTINDTIGHHIGDLMLKEVAGRLKACIRTEDFIARIGGDEFVIILSHVNASAREETVTVIAKKVVETIAQPFNLEGNNFKISASVGIAFYPDLETTHTDWVNNADVAMYHAKKVGRNNFQFYNPSLDDKYKKQIGLEYDLKFALERGEFYLVYQPIYNLLTRKVVSIEALIRWRHPDIGVVSPEIFIPMAEENGLIVDIGTWVLKRVCEQGAKWYKAGYTNTRISVNLSLHQFLQDNFAEMVKADLELYDFPPTLLELELTETKIITYIPNLRDTMKQIRNIGVGIAIDDFGTRYSFLTSLGSLPISTLKIDKAFLKDVITDAKNNIIVKALIGLAKNLGLNVIAEGVQSDEQVQFLVVNGCLQAQGYYLSKPLTTRKISALLHEEAELTKSTLLGKDV